MIIILTNFSRTIKEYNTEIEIFTYPNDIDITFFVGKSDAEESYFYLNVNKAKEFVKAINSAIEIIEGAKSNSDWDILKEFIKTTMNDEKVTLEDSCHYQTILNKMYELEGEK